jgi:hypothetical protein
VSRLTIEDRDDRPSGSGRVALSRRRPRVILDWQSGRGIDYLTTSALRRPPRVCDMDHRQPWRRGRTPGGLGRVPAKAPVAAQSAERPHGAFSSCAAGLGPWRRHAAYRAIRLSPAGQTALSTPCGGRCTAPHRALRKGTAMPPLLTTTPVCDRRDCPAPSQRAFQIHGQDFYFCGHHSAEVARHFAAVTSTTGHVTTVERRGGHPPGSGVLREEVASAGHATESSTGPGWWEVSRRPCSGRRAAGRSARPVPRRL